QGACKLIDRTLAPFEKDEDPPPLRLGNRVECIRGGGGSCHEPNICPYRHMSRRSPDAVPQPGVSDVLTHLVPSCGRALRLRQMMQATVRKWLPYLLPPPFGRRRDLEIRLDKHATVSEGGRSSNA